MGSVWLPSYCRTGTDTPRRVKAATREGHPASYPGGGARPEGSSAQARLSPFLWEACPSGRAFALATHSFLWRLRCRQGARLATGRLCVPAAVPLHYCKMSAVGLLEAVSRKQRPTCHSQISGPGSLPGPLTATLPARVPTPPELYTGLPATPPHKWVSATGTLAQARLSLSMGGVPERPRLCAGHSPLFMAAPMPPRGAPGN